jgi:protein required for attachment to host cells
MPPAENAEAPVSDTCVVVADAGRARFFRIEESDAPRVPFRLVEREALENPDLAERGRSVTGRVRTETNTNRQGGPKHPIGAQRERHRLDLERRFGLEIARKVGVIARDESARRVIFVAPPQFLGLVRGALRDELAADVELKEVAKDYTGLRAEEIRDRLPV